MPTLNWIGKDAVINHHKEVPFHLLNCDPKLSVGDHYSGNLLIQGDNLLALKALLAYYAGKVKAIYIDPPYNTGNESWVYNDNVNSSEIREWLGKVVGKEAEDLSRHDKWLCMMYPRLVLLRELLHEEGSFWMSIDDNEIHHARSILDDIFGDNHFITTISWQKIYTVKNSARHLSEMHDYIIVYAKNKNVWKRNLLPRTEKQDKAYSNPDNDKRGPWKATPIHARNYYSQGLYSITCPSSRVIQGPPSGTYWRFPERKFKELDKNNRIWWGESGDNTPAQKRFLTDVKPGVVPSTMWFYNDAGHNAEAKNELRQALTGTSEMFITPKPTRLIQQILRIATNSGDLILDSFAGSGTTGHAVMKMNKEDGGDRRFILVEMEKEISQNITAKRLEKAIEGYTWEGQRGKVNEVESLGGGFRYCTLDAPLFNAEGQIRDEVSFEELARHVFFTETGEPLQNQTSEVSKTSEVSSPLLGISNERAIYLLFNGILGDKNPKNGNILTRKILSQLPKHEGAKVIYGEGCLLSEAMLREANITFRQLPYEIKIN